MGPPDDPDTKVGALVSKQHLEKVIVIDVTIVVVVILPASSRKSP